MEKHAREDMQTSSMIDPFGRRITYLRVSVTDRCDFRCRYCMAEDMTFLPKSEILSLEELDRVCAVFIRRGVKKLRLTGGEPLVRRGIMGFIDGMSRHLASGALDELTLTTNASQLAKYARQLADNGIKRINVSLDTLDGEKFTHITRRGDLDKVLTGIEAAKDAGLKIKINTVALRGLNEAELLDITAWCAHQGFDLSFIETMPLGDIGGDRTEHYLPLTLVRERLAERWTVVDSPYLSGGPARYVTLSETGQKIGFITPMTHNFCDSCNRVRLTATGTLYMCLGQDSAVDLRAPLRAGESDAALDAAIDTAIARKPRGHDFTIEKGNSGPTIARHMNVTGG